MVIPCSNLREVISLCLFSLLFHLTNLHDSLHLRQRLIEQAFESALLEHDVPVLFEHRLESYTVHDSESESHPVHCVIRDLKTESTYEVHGYVPSY